MVEQAGCLHGKPGMSYTKPKQCLSIPPPESGDRMAKNGYIKIDKGAGENSMKRILQAPLYPFFLAAYPALALLSYNITQVKYPAAVRPVILAWLAAGLLLLIFRLIYRDMHRAAFIVAAWLLLFFSYGQIYDSVAKAWKIPHFTTWMLAAWLLLAILVLVLAALLKLNFEGLALTLNIVSLGLVLYVLVPVFNWSFIKTAPAAKVIGSAKQTLQVPTGETLPDIYYIMPEDYGRVDQLQRWAQIDTSSFQQFLKEKGFYVASCSQSNYVTSELSLGSALEMDYLPDLGPGFKPSNEDQSLIWNAIRYNTLEADLKKIGYTTVAFATGFSWSELDNSDVYITPPPYWSGLTSFENLLLRTTPVRHLEEIGVLKLFNIDAERYRERTLLVFDSVSRLSSMPGPKFVFMHIIDPHPPFVFNADGSKIADPSSFIDQNGNYTLEKYQQGYREDVPFADQELEKTVTTLISKSIRPIVIVIQTDTGPWFTSGPDQFTILNAYYMPGHTAQLYPGISPVNTFRVILNAYFNQKIPLLDDQSYFSPIPYIYDFSPVPNPCTAK
jgi:hypothetical protein